ncbi:MAG: alpha/beta hydrolase [Microthrixaceae bacterium]
MGTSTSRKRTGSPAVALHHRTVHGYRRAYRAAGDAGLVAGRGISDSGRSVLLMLHGIGDSSESWTGVIGPLAEEFAIVAPDLLGHGESDKPRADYSAAAFANGMRDLLEVLGIQRVTVMGHSLGGGVAAQFAYQYPERVERLVLVAPGGVDREVSPMLRVATVPFSELAVPLLHTPPGRSVVRVATGMLKLAGHDLAIDADDLRRVLEGLPEDGAFDAFTRTLRAVVDWRGQVVTMRDRVYLAATVPMAVMWGTRDAIIPVQHAQKLAEACPHAQMHIYEGAGHFPHHSEPERFVAEVTRFVRSTEPAPWDPELFGDYLRTGRVTDPRPGPRA